MIFLCPTLSSDAKGIDLFLFHIPVAGPGSSSSCYPRLTSAKLLTADNTPASGAVPVGVFQGLAPRPILFSVTPNTTIFSTPAPTSHHALVSSKPLWLGPSISWMWMETVGSYLSS